MLPALAFVGLISLGARSLPQDPPPPEVRATPEQAGVLREEFFVLETLPADFDLALPSSLARPHAEALVVGLAAWRRRDDAGGRMLEWDLRFPEQELRVLHVERDSESGPSLVWREWQAERGRTLILEPRPGGAARILEWGQARPFREDLAPGATLSLDLLERLRTGEVETGSFEVFDPLTRRTERLRVRLRGAGVEAQPAAARAPERIGEPAAEPAAEAGPPRLLELLRADGSIAGRYLFEGPSAAAFQWQAGHLRARRIDARDYRQRLAEAGRRSSDD